jgi:hypothetical protein
VYQRKKLIFAFIAVYHSYSQRGRERGSEPKREPMSVRARERAREREEEREQERVSEREREQVRERVREQGQKGERKRERGGERKRGRGEPQEKRENGMREREVREARASMREARDRDEHESDSRLCTFSHLSTSRRTPVSLSSTSHEFVIPPRALPVQQQKRSRYNPEEIVPTVWRKTNMSYMQLPRPYLAPPPLPPFLFRLILLSALSFSPLQIPVHHCFNATELANHFLSNWEIETATERDRERERREYEIREMREERDNSQRLMPPPPSRPPRKPPD